MIRKVLKTAATAGACLCLFAVLGIIGAIDGGAGLEIVPGLIGLTGCGGVFAGLAYLI